MARKKKADDEILLNVSSEEIQNSFIEDVEKGLDSNRAKEKSEISPEELDPNSSIKLEICDTIEKINNRYYLQVIKKYIDNLGG